MGFRAMTSVLILVITLSAAVCSADDVPVFVWGDLEYKSQSANPLERTTSAEFVNILRSELTQKPILIAFIEENLSVEDLSRRDESGSTLLPYLRGQLRNSLYLPSVQNPAEAIAKIKGVHEFERVRLTPEGLSKEIHPDSSLVMVELADAGTDESREALLRRHDAFMRDTVGKLADERDVVAVYTAKYPSWSEGDDEISRFRRHLMQADASSSVNSSSQQVYELNNLLLAISDVTVTTGGKTSSVQIPAAGPGVVVNNNTITVTLQDNAYKVTLTVHSSTNGYWALDTATVAPASGATEERYTIESVYALDKFSYHCGNVKLSAPNGTYVLGLVDLQLQPFFDGNATKFGDAFDCVGFFSVPIWSGIFVVTIMLAIFFYGVTSMMDIRTMDRFDDAKGKTITINASE